LLFKRLKSSLKFCFKIFLIFLSSLLYSGNKLIVGIYENKPLVYTENGRPKGIYVDIISSFARENNIELEFYLDEFSTLLDLIRNGKIDLISAIAYSKERESFITFSSEHIIINWGELFVHKDFIGKFEENHFSRKKYRIGVVKDDIYFLEFDSKTKNILNIDPDYVYYKDYNEILMAVQDKKVDIGIVGRLFGLFNKNLYKNISNLSFFIRPVELRIGFRKGFDKNIISLLDREILKYKNDSNFYTHFINSYIPRERDFFLGSYFIRVGFFVIIALFSLLIISVLLGLFLKKEINKHTKSLQELLKEKEILIKELHHRIKNNLQIIKNIAFLQMLSPISPSSLKDIELIYNRIESIGQFHKILYEYEMFENVNTLPLFDEFFKKVFKINSNSLVIKTDIESFSIDVEKAIQIGMLLGEISLFLNYNIDFSKSLTISFIMKRKDSKIYICFDYQGDCYDMSSKFLSEKTHSEILKLLLKQLKDEYKIVKSDKGCRLEILFSID